MLHNGNGTRISDKVFKTTRLSKPPSRKICKERASESQARATMGTALSDDA